MQLVLDHLVVAAATLDEGVAWCERTLGITPGPGGKHARFGTHNRLFSLASPAWPRAYFEIIAIDAQASAPAQPRWYGLDDPARQRRLAGQGPTLVQWVARCDDLAGVQALWRTAGIDVGEAIAAERATPGGRLRWRISVRDDGARLAGGAVPVLIDWGAAVHPTDAMPASGVALVSMQLGTLPAAVAIALPPGGITSGGAVPLAVVLDTPRGRVELLSA